MSTPGTTHTPGFGTGAAIATRQAGDVAILDISGRLTLGPALSHLAEAIKGSLDAGRCKILLNLGAVTYIDSSGIGELNATRQLVNSRGGALKLLQAPRRIQDLLRLVGMHPLFAFEQNEPDALAAFSRGA
jgi:anti-sigma B factor antagonist